MATIDWARLVADIEEELLRTSQNVAGVRTLPDQIEIRLGTHYAAAKPVLARVIVEIGEALVAWAARNRYAWGSKVAPQLNASLSSDSETIIRTRYSPPEVTTPGCGDQESR